MVEQYKITENDGFPYIGYTFDNDRTLYCKTCGAEDQESHADHCSQLGHWPSERRIDRAKEIIFKEKQK